MNRSNDKWFWGAIALFILAVIATDGAVLSWMLKFATVLFILVGVMIFALIVRLLLVVRQARKTFESMGKDAYKDMYTYTYTSHRPKTTSNINAAPIIEICPICGSEKMENHRCQ